MKQKKRTIKYLKNAAKNGAAAPKKGRRRPKPTEEDQVEISPEESQSVQAKDTFKQYEIAVSIYFNDSMNLIYSRLVGTKQN